MWRVSWCELLPNSADKEHLVKLLLICFGRYSMEVQPSLGEASDHWATDSDDLDDDSEEDIPQLDGTSDEKTGKC